VSIILSTNLLKSLKLQGINSYVYSLSFFHAPDALLFIIFNSAVILMAAVISPGDGPSASFSTLRKFSNIYSRLSTTLGCYPVFLTNEFSLGAADPASDLVAHSAKSLSSSRSEAAVITPTLLA
jgi:hypothetical protein